MTEAELYTALSSVCQTAYAAFRKAVEPPFICYRFADSADLMADDENYVPISGFDVEVYTEKKDLTLEADLTAVLKSLGLTWTRAELWIEEERLVEVVYSIEAVMAEASDDSS